MSIRECIEGSLLGGTQKENLLKEYDDTVAKYKQTMGDESAASAAALQIIEVKAARLKQKKLNLIGAAIAQNRIVPDLKRRARENGTTFNTEVANLLERAHTRGNTVFTQAVQIMGEFIEQHRVKWAGLAQDHKGMPDIYRALYGQDVDNPNAKLFAKQIRETLDYLHARYKAAGGTMGYLENYVPHTHNAERIKKNAPTADEWIEYLKPRLDMNRMIDLDTGLPFEEGKLIRLMRDMHADIVTHGMHSQQQRFEQGMKTFGKGKGIANRRESARFFHFKSADAMLEYNNMFGDGDTGLFDMLVNNMNMVSRDIGMLEFMGPMPDSLMSNLKLGMKGNVKPAHINGMYDVLSGRTMGDGTEGKFSIFLGNTQNIMRSAYLGSAPISAISDATFVALAARMNGLPVTETIGKYLKQLNPANPTDRRIMGRMGFIADVATGTSFSAARIAGELGGKDWSRWLASFTNKASGLEAMTEGAKNAVAAELMGYAAEMMHARKPWSSLEAPFRDAAEAHGITQAHWDIMRKADLFKVPENGATFLRPQEIAIVQGVDPKDALEASNLYADWIQNIRAIAANEPALRTRSITTGAAFGKADPGSLNRMFWSSVTMFKGFPITVIFNHLLPHYRDAKQGKAGNLAMLSIGMGILGAFSLQLSEMVKGKDPRDMNDGKFWAAAMAKGGGLGLFGDFLFADYSRFGRSPVTEAFGPVVGLTADTSRVFMGNFQRALDDESYDTFDKFTSDTFNLLKRNIPAGNLWYSRMALERVILDTAEGWIDPNFHNKKARIEAKMQRDYGQRYWWAPGEMTPDRPPETPELPFGIGD